MYVSVQTSASANANGGSISYCAPSCTKKGCNEKMKWKEDKLAWECNATIDGEGQHCRKQRVLKGSKFFDGFITIKQIGIFTKFLVYYFESSTTIQAASKFCGISLVLGYKWGLKIRQTFGVIKMSIYDVKLNHFIFCKQFKTTKQYRK